MFTFKSPVKKKKKWKVYLKSPKEMIDIYYEDTEPEDGYTVNGITDFTTDNVYINNELDGFLLMKTIRHELMHVYLWDLEKNDYHFSDEEVVEIMSVAAPLICEIANEIAKKIKRNIKE